MCTSIIVTIQCGLLSRRTNLAGSNIIAHAVVTMETLSLFRELEGIFKRTAFLKDGLAKYDVSAGCFLWCQRLVQYILACYEEKN